MRTLWLRVRAPFAAFRWMQAGVYRATSPIVPPSAAWGLCLNLAHIDMRQHDEGAVVTSVEMALFELQQKAGDDRFRALSRIVR